MSFRVVPNKLNKIRDYHVVSGDDFSFVFRCFDLDQDPYTDITAASLLVSQKGTSSLILTKTATVSSNELTFDFTTSDFTESGHYYYQVKVTDSGSSYVLACGEIEIIPLIQ